MRRFSLLFVSRGVLLWAGISAALTVAGLRSGVYGAVHPCDQAGTQVPLVKQSARLWWFNGESPAGYSVKVTLTLVNAPVGKTFDWSIITGRDEVAFDGATEGTSVFLKSIGASPPGLVATSWSVEVRDHASQDSVCSYGNEVCTPYSLAPVGTYDYGYFMDPQTGAKVGGYTSYIVYAVLDQFNANLPASAPLNEQFDAGSQHSEQNNNWGEATPTGSSTFSSAQIGPHLVGMSPDKYAVDVPWLVDEIGVAAQGSTPTPVPPASADAGQGVEYWTGAWRVGSGEGGAGQQVTCTPWAAKPICKWRLYLGYGRHE